MLLGTLSTIAVEAFRNYMYAPPAAAAEATKPKAAKTLTMSL